MRQQKISDALVRVNLILHAR
ncbi:MAG: hypothetical protein QOF56_4454, partial [Acidobacteriaceae bacterium]|nr:hypothetical protein [Acidobacteriaceae bacterium]